MADPTSGPHEPPSSAAYGRPTSDEPWRRPVESLATEDEGSTGEEEGGVSRLSLAVGIVVAVGITFAVGVAAGGGSMPWSTASDSRSVDEGAATTTSTTDAVTAPPEDEPVEEPGESAPTTGETQATTTSTEPPDAVAPTAAERYGWELVDDETFDGPQLDTTKWAVYEGEGNGGVGWRSPDAISQSDGTLKITGRGDVSGGMNWIGGRTYGRWEIRARSDAGSGYAPNLLLWPTSGNWPAEGEVNIMEIPAGDRAASLAVLHYGEDNRQYWQWTDGDFTQWHNFALEWLPDRVTVYIDGEEIASWDDPEAIPRAPLQLAMQNDVGPHGGFIPPRDETTPDEVSLEVDWVRIYAP